jgi:hypothetical protein
MAGRTDVRVGDTVLYQGKRFEVIQADRDSAFLTLKELPDGNRFQQAMIRDVQLVRRPDPKKGKGKK